VTEASPSEAAELSSRPGPVRGFTLWLMRPRLRQTPGSEVLRQELGCGVLCF